MYVYVVSLYFIPGLASMCRREGLLLRKLYSFCHDVFQDCVVDKGEVGELGIERLTFNTENEKKGKKKKGEKGKKTDLALVTPVRPGKGVRLSHNW